MLVARGEPRFHRVDADEIGAVIFGNEVETDVAGVGLGVDREEGGQIFEEPHRLRSNHAMAEIANDDQIGGRAFFGKGRVETIPRIGRQGFVVSYAQKLVTAISGGVFDLLDAVLERHSLDEFGKLV